VAEDPALNDAFEEMILERSRPIREQAKKNFFMSLILRDDDGVPGSLAGPAMIYLSRIEPESFFELPDPYAGKVEHPDEPEELAALVRRIRPRLNDFREELGDTGENDAELRRFSREIVEKLNALPEEVRGDIAFDSRACELLLLTGRPWEALSLCRAALERDPHYRPAMRNLIRIAFLYPNPRLAQEGLKHIIDNRITVYQDALASGFVSLFVVRDGGASSVFEECLGVRPDDILAHYGMIQSPGLTIEERLAHAEAILRRSDQEISMFLSQTQRAFLIDRADYFREVLLTQYEQ
jgi:hypothetical protein